MSASNHNVAEQLAEAKARRDELRNSYNRRLEVILADKDFDDDASNLPNIDELRRERAGLSDQIRHHKDEQDALTLAIESSSVHHTAARLRCIEAFLENSQKYVDEKLQVEADDVVERDQESTEQEIADYVERLQKKREVTLRRITNAKERTNRRNEKDGEMNLDELEEPDRLTVTHTRENAQSSSELHKSLRELRNRRSKLQAEVVKMEHEDKRMEESYEVSIKKAKLAAARDSRQCRELNSRNAALTHNAKFLLGTAQTENAAVEQMEGRPAEEQ